MISSSNNIRSLQEFLSSNNLSVLLVSNPYSIRYFTGFHGLSPEEREAFFLVTRQNAFLIVPRLYAQEAQTLTTECEIVTTQERGSFTETILMLAKKEKVRAVGFEENDLKFNEYQQLKRKLRPSPAAKLIERLRIVKRKEEISHIKKAQHVTKRAYALLIRALRVGDTERELSFRVKKILVDLGSEEPAFEPIIATGKGSALPHYMPAAKRLGKNEILLVDIGATYKGYRGDLTRTIYFGEKKNERFETFSRLVRKAQREALKNIKPGMTAGEAHEIARSLFANQNVADHFIHGLGHGIGLQVHEPPYLRSGAKEILKEGMVFSVEPGLYSPGWGGVRIEDVVFLTENGCLIL